MTESREGWNAVPTCAYCPETIGLRIANAGAEQYEPPDFICEECFTLSDTGPCFDDLPRSMRCVTCGFVLDTRWKAAPRARARNEGGE